MSAGPACAALLALPLAAAAAGLKLPNAREASILADCNSCCYYLYSAKPATECKGSGEAVYRSRDLVNWEGAWGTQICVSDSPAGPFRMLGPKMQPPEDYMTLDGTLFVENGVPWMVYAHEWIQMLDETMEAIPLKPDLSEAGPIHLFKVSDAPWFRDQQKAANRQRTYVTDGPSSTAPGPAGS